MTTAFAQNFAVSIHGKQTFHLKDERGRNQTTFTSQAPLEDITGTSSEVAGTVSFDPVNVSKTIAAEISVIVASLKTGIAMRDEHLQGPNWLDAAKYPTIQFNLKDLKNLKSTTNATVEGTAVGDFTLKGVTKKTSLSVSLTLMPASDQTKMRAPGDLLVVRAKGSIKLSDFGIKSEIIGSKISDEVRFEFNAVGSNATK